MSSLYYANALFSKYPAASSVFATGAFPEQTSCAFASNPQRPGYGAGSGASFAASMQGLYPGGGGMAGQSAAGVYAAGYGLEPSSFNMHCAPFEQNLSGVCPGDSAKAAGAKEQRDSDLAAETNFRIYPWMRSSGAGPSRASKLDLEFRALCWKTSWMENGNVCLKRPIQRDRPQARPPDLHPLPDPGAGEGVSLQSLPDPAAAHRDRARALPHRETDQDLVPEPAHEVEKGKQDRGPGGQRPGQDRSGGG
uniref:Homeobox B8 n=1 Tax=Equus caballus TaxID=9796 RepID=A0A3Q2HEH5_HORSE